MGADDESEILVDGLSAGIPKFYGENESNEFGLLPPSLANPNPVPTSVLFHMDDASAITISSGLVDDDLLSVVTSASRSSRNSSIRSTSRSTKFKFFVEDDKFGGLPKIDTNDEDSEADDIIDFEKPPAFVQDTGRTSVHSGMHSSLPGADIESSVPHKIPSRHNKVAHESANNTATGKRPTAALSRGFSLPMEEEDCGNDDDGPEEKNRTGGIVGCVIAVAIVLVLVLVFLKSGKGEQDSSSQASSAAPSSLSLEGEPDASNPPNSAAPSSLSFEGQPVEPSMSPTTNPPTESSTAPPTKSSTPLTTAAAIKSPTVGPTANPTSPPSSVAPTVSVTGYDLSLLPEDTAQTILNDSSSPQAKAYSWLLEDINQLLPDRLSDYRLNQRFAMATFYYATGGKSWIRNDGWLDHTLHECRWYSLGSSGQQASTCEVDLPNIELVEDGIFQHIWLSNNKISGTLPPELFWLTSLRSIHLERGHIGGTFPTEVDQLTNLEILSLQENQLESTLPASMSSLSSLSMLSFSQNRLQGSIPTEFGLLTNLQYAVWGTNRMMLGPLPTEVMLLTDLIGFSIAEMGLTGTIPSQIGLLTSVNTIDAPGNLLTGTIPSELGLLHEELLKMDISNNALSGQIPSQLGILSLIRELSIFDNRFAGTIPAGLGLLTALHTLNLSANNLFGTIPSNLGSLSNMELLWLSSNLLVGSIPTELGLMESLVALRLEQNTLFGIIPSQLGLLSSLAVLHLESNGLRGTIPETLHLLPNLNDVDLSQNTLSGVIPDGFCSVETLAFDCSSSLCGCQCLCDRVPATEMISEYTTDKRAFTSIFDSTSIKIPP